jgi:hypothetical protein
MKRTNYSLLLLCLIFQIATVTYSQKLELGLRGGINFATIHGNGVSGAKWIPGLHLGAFGRYGISDKVFLQPELLVSSKGYSFRQDNFSYTYRFRESLIYFDIPIMVGINATENINILMGLKPGFLIGAHYHENNPNQSGPNADQYASADVGLLLGGAYVLDNGLDLGLRLDYGLAKVFASDRQAYNLNIMFSVGYSLNRK